MPTLALPTLIGAGNEGAGANEEGGAEQRQRASELTKPPSVLTLEPAEVQVSSSPAGLTSQETKVRVVGKDGHRVTLFNVDIDDPNSRARMELLRELDAGAGITVSQLIEAVREKHGLEHRIGRLKMLVVFLFVLIALLFGVTLGTSVLAESLMKAAIFEVDGTVCLPQSVKETGNTIEMNFAKNGCPHGTKVIMEKHGDAYREVGGRRLGVASRIRLLFKRYLLSQI